MPCSKAYTVRRVFNYW